MPTHEAGWAHAEGALRGVSGRPMVLKRFVKGIEEEAFFQKRVPASRPDYVQVAELKYASGRSAEEAVITDAAGLAWVINLGCVDLNPHPVLATDLAHPDELRVDLDPMPGVDWTQIVQVALVVREVLADHGLAGWPKTSGSRGFHINVRIAPEWSFREVRLAAETVSREVELRAPDLATSRWWKEERGPRVFTDFNQNAYDRTVASVWSVRPTPDARVSTPLDWSEVPTCRPEELTVPVAVERFSDGDPWAAMDSSVGRLDSLLARAVELGPAERPPRGQGRRTMTMPLVEIARAKTKPEAMAGLDRWKVRHADVFARLEPADVLVDGMRGSSSLWYRIRVNLQHVPEELRPEQEPLEVDYDPWAGRAWPGQGEP